MKGFEILKYKLLKIFSDRTFIKLFYYRKFKEWPDLDNPKTFNEKIQWLKLNDRKDIYSTMADKYESKNYVSNFVDDKYIIPSLGVWDNFDDIDFDKLPDKFVLKTVHDSGGIAICKDKATFDFEGAKKLLEKHQSINYYDLGREWVYKNIKPRIMAEKLLDLDGKEVKDYKVFCFNGKAEYILVCSDRQTNLKETFFDTEWNFVPCKRPNLDINKNESKPKNLEKMIEIAEILSKDMYFLRVDFYDLKEELLIGELTFYPADGFAPFEPKEWDRKLGDKMKLPTD